MNLSDRMRQYEDHFKPHLIPGLPSIIRLDMRAGHTFSKLYELERPFDLAFANAMFNTTTYLCKNIPGAVLGYTQSDEISILMKHAVDKNETQFFGGSVIKIVSVTASMCTAEFNYIFRVVKQIQKEVFAEFDSRVFNLPDETEVANYFMWREKDAERNYLGMMLRSLYPHKELVGKKRVEQFDMLMAKGINWNNLPEYRKRGWSYVKTDAKEWKPIAPPTQFNEWAEVISHD